MRSIVLHRIALCCWLLLACAWPGRAHAVGEDHVLVLGRVSDNPRLHYEQLKPLLDYVVPRMANVGIREGRILMARDAQQMTSYMRRGQVDWVTETAGSAMALQQRAGAKPLLLTERDGVGKYHTVFFSRVDSGIDTLADLNGRSVAFQNGTSTSAYFMPADVLLRQNRKLEILLSPQDKPDARSVGYLFARTELNISTWVHKRLVDVGVMSNLDWNNPAQVPAAYRRDLRIIHETPDYPRALEMVRGDMDPKVQARLREVLIEASADPRAREAMLQFFKTTRFLPIDPQAVVSLAQVREAVARVRTKVE